MQKILLILTSLILIIFLHGFLNILYIIWININSLFLMVIKLGNPLKRLEASYLIYNIFYIWIIINVNSNYIYIFIKGTTNNELLIIKNTLIQIKY